MTLKFKASLKPRPTQTHDARSPPSKRARLGPEAGLHKTGLGVFSTFGFRVWGLGFSFSLGFRFWGVGFKGLGFGVQGLEFRDLGSWGLV